MDSANSVMVQPMLEMQPSYMTATYQAQQNSYTGAPRGYREPRQNARTDQQWSSSRRRHPNKNAPTEYGDHHATPEQVPWQDSGVTLPGDTSPNASQKPQTPVAVKLFGLPPALCRQVTLDAMLEQAGLTNSIMGCVLGQEQDVGKALIYLADRNTAQICVEHFSGCCWDRSGKAVTAQVVDDEGLPGQSRQATGNFSNGFEKNQGTKGSGKGKSAKGSKGYGKGQNNRPDEGRFNTKKMDTQWNMGGPQPMMAVPTVLVAMPQPPPPMLPVGMHCSPAWGELQPSLGQSFLQMPGMKNDMVYDNSDESSTVAGGSSGRASCDMTGAVDFAEDFACDTDDGF